jgi:predicted sulfurtransferase
LWAGKLFVFDERPAVRLAGRLEGDADARHTPGGGIPHLPGVLGRCLLCAAPHDVYAWLRCRKCGVLVLVCDACVEGSGGEEAVKPRLACAGC